MDGFEYSFHYFLLPFKETRCNFQTHTHPPGLRPAPVWPAEGEDLLFQTGSILSANQPYICTFLIVSFFLPDSLSVCRAVGFNRPVLVSVEKHRGALLWFMPELEEPAAINRSTEGYYISDWTRGDYITSRSLRRCSLIT